MAMNWAQVTQKKQQQAQVYVSTICNTCEREQDK